MHFLHFVSAFWTDSRLCGLLRIRPPSSGTRIYVRKVLGKEFLSELTSYIYLFLKKQHELFWTSFDFSSVAPGPDSCTLHPLLVSPVVLAKQIANPGLSCCVNPKQDQPTLWRRSCFCVFSFPRFSQYFLSFTFPHASWSCFHWPGRSPPWLFLVGFLPQMLYFWSGNPAPQRLVYASLPRGFSVFSFVPFFYRFLTGQLARVVSRQAAPAPGLHRHNESSFLQCPRFRSMDIQCVPVRGWLLHR